jgi:hypothetical protein
MNKIILLNKVLEIISSKHNELNYSENLKEEISNIKAQTVLQDIRFLINESAIDIDEEYNKNLNSHNLDDDGCVYIPTKIDPNAPYKKGINVYPTLKYNHDFGDDKICKCGHPYHRHFDSYEQMRAVGCKYCQCYTFEEIDPKVLEESETKKKIHIEKLNGLLIKWKNYPNMIEVINKLTSYIEHMDLFSDKELNNCIDYCKSKKLDEQSLLFNVEIESLKRFLNI